MFLEPIGRRRDTVPAARDFWPLESFVATGISFPVAKRLRRDLKAWNRSYVRRSRRGRMRGWLMKN